MWAFNLSTATLATTRVGPISRTSGHLYLCTFLQAGAPWDSDYHAFCRAATCVQGSHGLALISYASCRRSLRPPLNRIIMVRFPSERFVLP